ncbi:MAG TPA: hypothetical protein VF435_13740 [Pyrinomonadaceae bacterium]
MEKLARRMTLLALVSVFSLLVTATTALAQNPIVTDTYAAKFICGVQKDPSLLAVPDAQAGHYSTKINVHNNTGLTISFRKKVIQLKGGQIPIAPQFRRDEKLDPDWAMEVVCRDIYGHLNIPVPPIPPPVNSPPPPYIEGFVIFEVFYQQLPASPPIDPLDVEGIYTYRAEPAGTDAVSIDVEVFPVKRNRHPLLPVIADPTGQPAALNKRLQQPR